MSETNEDDERALAKVLIRLLWPTGWTCPCGCKKYYHLRCRPRALKCADCRKERSITAGTLLHGTRLPLRSWFTAIERFVQQRGISAHALAALLGIHLETAWQMLHRIRFTFAADEPLLAGIVKYIVTVVVCREPRVDPAVECAVLAGVEGKVRVVVGSPSVDPALGGTSPGQWTRFAWLHGSHGGDPASVGTIRRPVDLEGVLAPGAELSGIRRGEPEIQVRYDLEKRLRTFRAVSERWLSRYTGAFAGLWSMWSERGGRYRTCAEREEVAHALLARCLRRPRTRFEDLVPACA